jgi:hypothetical protein
VIFHLHAYQKLKLVSGVLSRAVKICDFALLRTRICVTEEKARYRADTSATAVLATKGSALQQYFCTVVSKSVRGLAYFAKQKLGVLTLFKGSTKPKSPYKPSPLHFYQKSKFLP